MDYKENQIILMEEENEDHIAFKKETRPKKISTGFSSKDPNFDIKSKELENNYSLHATFNNHNDLYHIEDQSKFR